MSSFTIHAIDPELDRILSERARERTVSKNRLIQELLADSLGLAVEGELPDDYREFAGLWSDAELVEFEAATASDSVVEPADWA